MTETLIRSATLAPSSLDEARRTVRVTVSTGAPVVRRDMTGAFLEVLDLNGTDPGDMVGKPVLDAHRTGSVQDIIGAVTAAGRDAAGLWADIKISERAAGIWTDIRAGIIRGVSIGYSVSKWRDSKAADGTRVRVAVNWRVAEVSFVPVPADPAATVRSQEDFLTDTITAAPAETAAQSVVPPAAQNRAAVNAEIRSAARIAGLDQAWVDSQIDAGATVEQARAAAWQALEARAAAWITSVPATVRVTGANDDPAAIRDAMASAIVARCTRSAPEGRAREFAGWSVADMGAELANTRGARLDPRNRQAVVDALLTRSGAHTTSDFPLLLESAGNKMLLPAYEAAAPTYRLWAAQKSFNDFNPHKFLRVGDFPQLAEITSENAGIQYGTLSENRETVTPKEYGMGLMISRRMLINDDLSAFSDFSSAMGIRVAADENRLVYAHLVSNPTLSDSVALFHSSHGNLAGSGTTIDVTNVAAAVAALRRQTSPDGLKLNLQPVFLVVGPDRELLARQILTAVAPATTSGVNPYAGSLQLIVDANLSGNRWYIFASPAVAPVIVYGYVYDTAGPQLKSEVNFDTRAIKVAVSLDFGYGAIDYRGAYLNTGNRPWRPWLN